MHNRQYELRYLPLFQHDLNEIISYISFQLQNPAAAEALLDAVEDAILTRSTCAEAFEPYRPKKSRTLTYYRIYISNYTVYYTVLGNVMEVHRILYNKRNTQEIF